MMRLTLLVFSWAMSGMLCYAQPDVAASDNSALAPTQAVTTTKTTATASAATTATANASSKTSRKPKTVAQPARKDAPPLPNHIYVVEGCEACNGLQSYLRKVGVKLTVSKVDQSPYSTFPTVVYSDGTTDNGERIYSKRCKFPRNVPVDECGG